ncbi:MAG TPA: trypsin-like peptidase domain-containing protein [Candidatus Scatomorpha stercorigallinarum]|nr:trypsin-like peptidase domain-containing protein [Candidatus Scatomorpha stercorigallinarum]
MAIGLICLVVIAASSLIFTQDRAAEPTPPAEQTAPSQPGGFDDYRDFFDHYYDASNTITGENDIPRAELEPDVRLTTAPVPDETEELTLRELYERCIPSVVGITAMVPDGSGYFWGTGIILTEDGYIVTNTHILDGTDSVTVTLWDDRELEAKLVGADNVSDLAVLKVEAEGLTPAEFCGTAVSVGDAVAALGNPLGEELRGTLTDGIISAINRDVSYNSHSMTLLQTNAAINEGNSGGPLLNMYGQVVGITNMKMMGTSAYSAIEGIGFAIPTSTIQEVVNQLLRNGRVTGRAAIGVTIGPIPEDAAAAYSLPDGLYVVSVAEGSDAAAKGLAEGDVITAIDGQGVTTTAQVGEIIAGLEVGDTITMTVYRNGETFDVEVALVETSDIY